MRGSVARLIVFCTALFIGVGIPTVAESQLLNAPVKNEQPETTSAVRSVTLAEVQALAVQNHPALRQAAHRLEAIRGEFIQVGLRTNPEIGYVGEEMTGHHAGRQGVAYSQPIIPQYKLTARQAAVDREYRTAGQWYQVHYRKVENDAMLAAYRVAFLQQKSQLIRGLLQTAEEAKRVGNALLEAGEIPRSDYLDMKIQAQRTQVALRDTQLEYQSAQKELAILLSFPPNEPIEIKNDVTAIPPELSYHNLRNEILNTGPELLAAKGEVEAAQARLRKECAEAGLDYNTEAMVAYNNETKNTEFTVGISIPIKLFDRNQGNIHRSRAEVVEANANVERVRMNLDSRFERLYGEYEIARNRVIAYRQDILTEARESLDLALNSYRQGEYGSLELLVTQRTLFSVQVEYIDNLQNLTETQFLLTGLLLTGGLEKPER